MANVFIFPMDDNGKDALCGVAMVEGRELENLLPWIQEKVQVGESGPDRPDGRCCLWGVRESGDHSSAWSVMEKGDLVLGFRNRSIAAAAYVLAKIRNPSLAARLWSNTAGEPLSLMCLTDEPHLGDVPIVPQMERYLDRDCRDFTRLDSEKRDRILSDYGSLETFVRLCLRYDFPFSFRHSE